MGQEEAGRFLNEYKVLQLEGMDSDTVDWLLIKIMNSVIKNSHKREFWSSSHKEMINIEYNG
jgi:hypothetical protein